MDINLQALNHPLSLRATTLVCKIATLTAQKMSSYHLLEDVCLGIMERTITASLLGRICSSNLFQALP